MATKRKKPARAKKMSPEKRAAVTEVEGGVKGIAKAIVEIQRGLREAERMIEADARARIQGLRKEARVQLAGLQSRRRDLMRMLRGLSAAAEGSWQDVKGSVDAILGEARNTAASVIDRFRSALRT